MTLAVWLGILTKLLNIADNIINSAELAIKHLLPPHNSSRIYGINGYLSVN